MRKIGIFGGSFDPIHFGHLRPALEILEALSLDHMRFIPSGQPPHRDAPVADAAQRLAMLKAAVAGRTNSRMGVSSGCWGQCGIWAGLPTVLQMNGS